MALLIHWESYPKPYWSLANPPLSTFVGISPPYDGWAQNDPAGANIPFLINRRQLETYRSPCLSGFNMRRILGNVEFLQSGPLGIHDSLRPWI